MKYKLIQNNVIVKEFSNKELLYKYVTKKNYYYNIPDYELKSEVKKHGFIIKID